MSILALDTATLVSSVAIAEKDRVLAELTMQTNLTHSELLMPHIKQILQMANVDKKDLKGIAVSIGPGSFTGLRIGLATAKSLAYALKIPIVGVPTLAALAYNCPVPNVYLAPMLDAQKQNAYVSLFHWENSNLIEDYPTAVKPFAEILESAKELDKPVIFLGEVAIKNSKDIEAVGGNVILAQPHIIIPRASSVAALGHSMLENKMANDVMNLEPLYIRRSEAEVLWERKNGVCV